MSGNGTTGILTAQTNGGAEEQAATQWFALGLSSVFFLLELINIRHHVMWRDEWQIWIVARHSNSIRELLHLKRYEGHPDAWYVLVYFVSRLTSNPVAMQLLHLVIASVTAYVVARYSPFTRFQKTLIAFGYFLFYEYAAISRDYALGVLCLFSFCAVFRAGPRKSYLLLAFLLALMAQSNVYALLLALAFTAGILFEVIRAPVPRQFLFPNARRVAFAATLFVASVSLSVLRMRPPEDSGFATGWNFDVDPDSVGRTLGMMWKSFVPVPELTRHFWNTNIVPEPSLPAIVVLCISALFFIRKPTVLFMYLSGLGSLLLFKHVKYVGYLRHDGHAFILFLACVWLASTYPEERFPLRKMDSFANRFTPLQTRVLVGLLAIHVAVAFIACTISFKVPFSQAKATADFLRSRHLDKIFIVGDLDYPLSSVAGHLDREIYYPRGNRMGSYIIWDTKRLADPKQPAVELAKEQAAERHQDVLAVLNYPLKTIGPSVHELASFQGSIVGDEDYYIYLIKYEPPAPVSLTHPLPLPSSSAVASAMLPPLESKAPIILKQRVQF